MIQALDISSSALVAQRTRMNVIAGNIANAFTTAQEDGRIEPYRRRVTLFSPERSGGGVGVRVQEVALDPSEFRLVADAGHKRGGQQLGEAVAEAGEDRPYDPLGEGEREVHGLLFRHVRG